jgi:D-alanyl-lipoteichoic acid acyltransferase DltB (MBOAT superfamily)
MLFNSIEFVIFFVSVVAVYFITPVKWRTLLLLLASYGFYMAWKPIFIILILFSTGVDYWVGQKMSGLATKKERKPYLNISLLANIGLLAFFKYFYFLTDSGIFLADLLGISLEAPAVKIILPMGISFYTFQTISYSVDIYKGKIKAEKSFLKFALYVTFFPQLVAGPIERAKDLIAQFHFKYTFDYDRILLGLKIMLWGFFKKVVIADQLVSMVGYVFTDTAHAHGLNIYLSILLFTVQIYCDFSGYSDIAQGSAKVLGVNLMDNFKFPFFSKSFSELWARWHVSLMQFFRDYIMFPLVRKKYKWEYVFMLVFLISGLWHGASWNFVIWGGLNGLFVIYSKSTANTRAKWIEQIGLAKLPRVRSAIQTVGIVHLFAFPGIYFLSGTFDQSTVMLTRLFTDWDLGIMDVLRNTNGERDMLLYMGKDAMTFFVIMGYVLMLFLVEHQMNKGSLSQFFTQLKGIKSWAFFVVIIFSIALMSNVDEVPFIYFQF